VGGPDAHLLLAELQNDENSRDLAGFGVASRLLYEEASERGHAFRPAASAFSWSNRLATMSCQ
jgi:hypothetical protein